MKNSPHNQGRFRRLGKNFRSKKLTTWKSGHKKYKAGYKGVMTKRRFKTSRRYRN